MVTLCEASRAFILQLPDNPENADVDDQLLTARLEAGAPPCFFSPWQFLDTLDVDRSYHLIHARLSERAVPFPRSSGQVRLVVAPGVDLVWEGAEVERQRRSRRRRPAPFHDIHIGMVPDENMGPNNEEGVLPQEEEANASESTSSSSSSSSSSQEGSSDSSSSSSSSSSTSGDDEAPRQEAGNVENEVAEVARPAVPEGVVRVHRPESYEWGLGFRLTYKPPTSYQASCRYHARHEHTKCTKLASWNIDENGGAERVQRGLKLWCLRALDHQSKASHQGRRGLPAFSAAETALSDLDIETRVANMPAPPD